MPTCYDEKGDLMPSTKYKGLKSVKNLKDCGIERVSKPLIIIVVVNRTEDAFAQVLKEPISWKLEYITGGPLSFTNSSLR